MTLGEHSENSRKYLLVSYIPFFRFVQSFNRTNLKYEVHPKKPKSVTNDLIDMIKNKFDKKCGIVYCLSRSVYLKHYA